MKLTAVKLTADLERAWKWREERGAIREAGEALRMFYGPGESTGAELASLAIDRFGEHYWMTWWAGRDSAEQSFPAPIAEAVRVFLERKGARSAVVLFRPPRGTPELPTVLFGVPPEEMFEVREAGLKFNIRLLGARHPGLFLDHAPLRGWLQRHASGWRVLNTFAYTGSLSVAAGAGGAREVTTLDLSSATVRWAEENWKLNGLPAEHARFISGDVFDWLPRLARKGERYDCVILDPPSFSRGKKGNFSVLKDNRKLHEIAIALVQPQGVLITSTNCEELSVERFEADVQAAARAAGRSFEVLGRIELPETFPTKLGDSAARYLKGLILRGSG